jgi:hypothetical protein
MAETVTVAHGDTLTGILKRKRGLDDGKIHTWLRKVRPINPHIGDLNHIYPGEILLIPDSLLENVSDERVWQNAFSRIPRELESPHNGHTQFFLTTPGTTIDDIAKGMFDQGPHRDMFLSTKRAVLIHNNPELEQYLDTGRVPAQRLVDITPLRLTKFDKAYWQGERSLYASYLRDMDPTTLDMYQQVGPEDTFIISRLIEVLKEKGAAVGKDDVVKAAGYGVGGVSGLAASADMAVSNINGLLQKMAKDAVEKFGLKMAASKKTSQLAQVAKFLRSHPNYPQVMRQVQEIPEFLLPMPRSKLVPPAAANVNSNALARWFRKGYFQAFRRWPSRSYMAPIARQLNGRVGFFRALGRHATWYVPTVIGLYNVYEASPEIRMRTLFAEGVGVVGGYAGTLFGTKVALIGAGIASLCGLCIGPLGLFVVVFLFATAGGLAGNELFRWFGGKAYDAGNKFGDHIYHSIDGLIGDFQ